VDFRLKWEASQSQNPIVVILKLMLRFEFYCCCCDVLSRIPNLLCLQMRIICAFNEFTLFLHITIKPSIYSYYELSIAHFKTEPPRPHPVPRQTLAPHNLPPTASQNTLFQHIHLSANLRFPDRVLEFKTIGHIRSEPRPPHLQPPSVQ
jgi:hypothetical protein